MNSMKITKRIIRQAKEVKVFLTFTGDDESWVRVSKSEIEYHLISVPKMTGELDSDRILWISY